MAYVSGSAYCEEVPWLGAPDYGGLPMAMPTSFFGFYLWIPVSGWRGYTPTWNAGFRGTIYIKIQNSGSSTASVRVQPGHISIGDTTYPYAITFVDEYNVDIGAGEEAVVEVNLDAWSLDVYVIDVNNNNAPDIYISGIQLEPFTASVFWTGHVGVIEIP